MTRRIVSDPDIMHGAPCFEGTRIDVETVLHELRMGTPLLFFVEDLGITVSEVLAAVAWSGSEPPALDAQAPANDAEFDVALARLYELMLKGDAATDLERFELARLVLCADGHQSLHLPIDPPHPVDVVRLRMEELGLGAADLEPVLGSAEAVRALLAKELQPGPDLVARLARWLDVWLDELEGDFGPDGGPRSGAEAAAFPHEATRAGPARDGLEVDMMAVVSDLQRGAPVDEIMNTHGLTPREVALIRDWVRRGGRPR